MTRCQPALVAVALFTSGCDLGIVYVDPPAPYEKGGFVISGDPYVELGLAEEQLYGLIEPGDEVAITSASQGGEFVHPAIRTKGIGTPATIDCSITTSDGEEVAAETSVADFVVATEGYLEVDNYALRITVADVEALDGVAGTIHCRVTENDNSDRTADSSVEVVLSK